MNVFGECTTDEAYDYLRRNGHLSDDEMVAADELREVFEGFFPGLDLDPEKFRRALIVGVRKQSGRGSKWDAVNTMAAITAAAKVPIETTRLLEMRHQLESLQRQAGEDL